MSLEIYHCLTTYPMKFLLIIALLASCAWSITCPADFYEYVDTILGWGNYKCVNDGPITISNPCVDAEMFVECFYVLYLFE